MVFNGGEFSRHYVQQFDDPAGALRLLTTAHPLFVI